jgi:peroxiredoxin
VRHLLSTDVYSLPPDLPVPEDDGAADHLVGLELPDLTLASSLGDVNVRDFDVLYLYPRSGRPGVPLLPGWDETPGARGCTPQSCAFRDTHGELQALGVRVAGLSAQTLDDQREFAERNEMPFPVVADPDRKLGAALNLPTFEIEGLTLYKRLTLVAEDARIVKVFYPVFPPDANASDVLRWLRAQSSRSGAGEAGASAPDRAPSSLRP